MKIYNLALFAHIAGAAVLLSFGFVMPLLGRRIAKTPTVASLREWVEASYRYGKMGPPAAVVVLLSGLYMAFDAWSFADAWIVVSLVLFVMAGGIAGGVLDPHFAKALEKIDDTPAGPVPADLRAMVTEPRVANFESVMFGFDVAIVFMMTNKPGLTGSLIAAAVGLAISGALIARRSRATATAHAV